MWYIYWSWWESPEYSKHSVKPSPPLQSSPGKYYATRLLLSSATWYCELTHGALNFTEIYLLWFRLEAAGVTLVVPSLWATVKARLSVRSGYLTAVQLLSSALQKLLLWVGQAQGCYHCRISRECQMHPTRLTPSPRQAVTGHCLNTFLVRMKKK